MGGLPERRAQPPVAAQRGLPAVLGVEEVWDWLGLPAVGREALVPVAVAWRARLGRPALPAPEVAALEPAGKTAGAEV